MGGTQFIGRAVVEELIRAGDEVVLFHRGVTGDDLFPELEHRHGDRGRDLSALAVGHFDATIDTSAYVPRHVRELAATLGPRAGRYVHVSSISAYAAPPGPGGTEDLPLVEGDPSTEVVTWQTYGGLKALCEIAATESFGPGGVAWSGEPLSIVRPTYVAGPFDHTGRFTWWVLRAQRGGRMLAPGPRDNPFQIIDVRDLAAFLARLAHGEATGTFHTTGPQPPFSFEDFLDTVVEVAGAPDTELVWVDAEWLAANGVTATDLPLWEGLDEGRFANALDSSRALAAGLVIRPLAETVRDVLAHEASAATALANNIPDADGVEPTSIGLSPARERALLADAVS